jgi:hypothetical protein
MLCRRKYQQRAGQIEATLIPEPWLLDRHHTQLSIAGAEDKEAERLESARLSLSKIGEESRDER